PSPTSISAGAGYASAVSCRVCDSSQAEISSAQVTNERRVRPSCSSRSAKGTVLIGTPALRGCTSHRQCGSPWSEHPVEKPVASLPSVIRRPLLEHTRGGRHSAPPAPHLSQRRSRPFITGH